MSTPAPNLLSPNVVRGLLSRHGIRPRKRWGQNFLIDRNALDRILLAADLQPDSAALEIGSGLGTLTRELAAHCRRVTAVEIDPVLHQILTGEMLAGLDNVTVIHADALQVDLGTVFDEFGPGRHQVVANIPYSVTSPLIVRLLEHRERLQRLVLLVQKEVADRLAAPAGSDDYGSLSVLAQFYADVDVVGRVSPRAFYPVPDVNSAILHMEILPEPRISHVDTERYFAIVHAAFQQRRKTLLNALANSPHLGWTRERATAALAAAGIDPARRGETLTLEEFGRLAEA